MTFLPPRVASWRYQRGTRSLATNLSDGDGHGKSSTAEEEKNLASEEEEIEVPDEVDEVIDQLIQGLGCTDSIVR